MKTKLFTLICIILLAGMLASCNAVPKVEWTLTINGAVETPISFSYAELAKMEQVEYKDILMVISKGPDEIRTFSGALIDALLAQAGVGSYASITVTAADGYQIEVTKEEMNGGIVALKDAGEWIAKTGTDEGPIRLVFPETPSNRWVYQVIEITVNQ